ncbi:MAG: ATP-binding protein, partial [Candidatus Eisenbacteria bacterium]
ILTEIVANSLDSGARRIVFHADPASATLTVTDDGSGMQRRDLGRYHDLATSTKTRGAGIGFAGVGIKLGLLVCDEVITETRRAKSHAATTWSLSNRHKAPWKWLATPPGMVTADGTAVRLRLSNPLSPLLDAGFIEAALRRHFEALLDPGLDELLLPLYRHVIEFEVNGQIVTRQATRGAEHAVLLVRLMRKRKPSAVGWLVRESAPLPEDRRGVAVSTYGKVIKRGWDWLGVTPANPDRIAGLIEAPALAECLTLNKGDFIRTGPRGATYLAYRRAIQEAVTQQFVAWGDSRDGNEPAQRRAARPVERDLESVLVDMADDFPMLASLVEQRLGGQRKLPIGKPGAATGASAFLAASLGGAAESATATAFETAATATADAPDSDAAALRTSDGPAGAENPTSVQPQQATSQLPSAAGPKRPARYGLMIQYQTRAEDPELSRLVDTIVWINDAHPAYRRAVASRSEGYHLALSVAMALAPLAAEVGGQHEFVTAFMSRWGEALEKPKAGRRGGR